MKIKLSALLFASAIACQSAAKSSPMFVFEQLVKNNGEPVNDWIENNQPFVIQLTKVPSAEASPSNHSLGASQFAKVEGITQFQILLGDTEISSLFEYSNHQLVYSGEIPLPSGENNLQVNQLIEQQWVPVGEVSLSVLTSTGFKQAEWTPRLELNINSQLDEQVTGDATPSDKPKFTELTTNIGLSSHHQSDGLNIESNINAFAVSDREQAIQFANRGQEASKLDIADYSININKGNHQLVVGHTSYGSNSLVIDNVSRRGISWQYQNQDEQKNENELSFNGAILSGSDIVGYQNLLGLSDHSQQFVNSLGFGFKFLNDSRISLRLEGNYVDAEKLSLSDFGTSEITSAEKNQAIGMRLIAMDSDGRFDANLTLGISRYTNPDDPELNSGEQLVELNTENAIAHNLNLSYILLQDWQTPWGTSSNVTLTANHSSTEPLYQTLTAFVQANLRNKMLGANFQFGQVSGNLAVQNSRDNLDNLVNLLTTKTKLDSFSLNLPLAAIYSSSEASSSETSSSKFSFKSYLPSVDYSYQKTHQLAINSPDSLESGFNQDSHLPDQITTSHDISNSWQFETFSLSLQSSHSFQDNRQIGREESDFKNLQHSVSFNWQQNENNAWVFSFSKNRQLDLEASKIQYSESAAVSYNWQSIEGLALAISYALNKENDSLKESKSFSNTADISIIKSLTKGEWLLPVDGSVSLRVNYNDSELIDNIFEQRNKLGTTTAQLAISLSF